MKQCYTALALVTVLSGCYAEGESRFLGVGETSRYTSLGAWQDLDLVRKIRNDFAHRVTGLSFMDSSVADRCDAFQCTEERFGALDGLRDAFPKDSRSLFSLAVGLLAYYLDRRVEFAKRAEAANPPLWEFPSESREDAPVGLADDS